MTPPAAEDVVAATARYEAWLDRQIESVPAGRTEKHAAMASGRFAFLRATFYRFAQRLPAVCERQLEGPAVLGIGDLHVENLGTWRTTGGALAWGVNDLDEAAELPFAADLIRLATSALAAAAEGRLDVHPRAACTAILDGYATALAAAPAPFVLSGAHRWLADLAADAIVPEPEFARRLAALPAACPPVPAAALRALGSDADADLRDRRAGLGSRDHRRVVAVLGPEGREAKQLAGSAWAWARSASAPAPRAAELAARAARAPDPSLRAVDDWTGRRLARDSGRIALARIGGRHDRLRLLGAMGREAANVHHGTPAALPEIRAELARRGRDWLHDAATAMAADVDRDWRAYAASAADAQASETRG